MKCWYVCVCVFLLPFSLFLLFVSFPSHPLFVLFCCFVCFSFLFFFFSFSLNFSRFVSDFFLFFFPNYIYRQCYSSFLFQISFLFFFLRFFFFCEMISLTCYFPRHKGERGETSTVRTIPMLHISSLSLSLSFSPPRLSFVQV